MKKFHSSPFRYINKVVLRVVDLERSIGFYQKMMGLKILWEEKGRVGLSADGVQPLLELVRPEDAIPKQPRRTGLYHYAPVSYTHLDVYKRQEGLPIFIILYILGDSDIDIFLSNFPNLKIFKDLH